MDITIDDFQEAIHRICTQVRESAIRFDFIVSISRGGLIPGVLLSHNLQIPLRVVEWSTRDTGLKLCPKDIARDAARGKSVLVVDDIVDSGITIRELIDSWELEDTPNIKVACVVYNKAQDIVIPDFYYEVIDKSEDNSWINFWWEKK